MSYSTENKLDCILEWSKSNKKFNPDTFIGIQENYENYGSFTVNQEIAIENVFYRWKIDEWCVKMEKISSDNYALKNNNKKKNYKSNNHAYSPGCDCWRCTTGEQLGECYGFSD